MAGPVSTGINLSAGFISVLTGLIDCRRVTFINPQYMETGVEVILNMVYY